MPQWEHLSRFMLKLVILPNSINIWRPPFIRYLRVILSIGIIYIVHVYTQLKHNIIVDISTT